MFKNVTISFLLLFSFNVASEEFYELPNEVWSCWGDTPTFSISPNGKYLAIMRSPREDVCDIEQDKIKGVEDEMTYQSLTFIDLETMQSRVFSDGIGEKSIYGFQWVSDDRFIYRPGLTNAKGRNMNSLVTFAVNVDGSKRKIIGKQEMKGGQGSWTNISVVDRLDADPDHVIVTSNERRAFRSDFYKMNIMTGKKKLLAIGFVPKNAKGDRVYGTYRDQEGYPIATLVDESLDRVIYTYDKDTKEWSEHVRFTCQQPSFTPIAATNKGWLVTGSKFSPSGELIEYNDTNALRTMGMFPEGYVVNHYLTDTDAFFIKTDVPNGLKMFVRAPIKTAMEGDFETGNVRYKARERYSFGFSDPRGIFGSPGA